MRLQRFAVRRRSRLACRPGTERAAFGNAQTACVVSSWDPARRSARSGALRRSQDTARRRFPESRRQRGT